MQVGSVAAYFLMNIQSHKIYSAVVSVRSRIVIESVGIDVVLVFSSESILHATEVVDMRFILNRRYVELSYVPVKSVYAYDPVLVVTAETLFAVLEV